jgi:hypothetical protein
VTQHSTAQHSTTESATKNAIKASPQGTESHPDGTASDINGPAVVGARELHARLVAVSTVFPAPHGLCQAMLLAWELRVQKLHTDEDLPSSVLRQC